MWLLTVWGHEVASVYFLSFTEVGFYLDSFTVIFPLVCLVNLDVQCIVPALKLKKANKMGDQLMYYFSKHSFLRMFFLFFFFKFFLNGHLCRRDALMYFIQKIGCQTLCSLPFTLMGVVWKNLYVDVPPDFEILTFAIPYFVPIYYPSIYQFCTKNTQFAKIGCFLPSFAQNTPNLCKLGAFILWSKPPDHYIKICEKVPRKAGTYMYIMSMWVPQDTDHLMILLWSTQYKYSHTGHKL